MKKLSSILVSLVLLTILSFNQQLYAQVPQKMSYQAVIRNSANNPVVNTAVGMKISILQTSASGTPVYEETQTPTTNANGLVSIEIGSGTIISGVFSSINWTSGTYFIKTETDPIGGTSYTITGTSQLLSVPYALYAKTAENGFSGNYNDLTNKPVSHSIGEQYQGGIIFYVYDNGQHGLIASKTDLGSVSGVWGSGETYAYGTGIGSGINNSLLIITKVSSQYVVKKCFEYSTTVDGVIYGNWYLPSLYELKLLYLQKTIVGGFSTNLNYFSSTEESLSNMSQLSFVNGTTVSMSKSNISGLIRAIKAF